MYYTVKALVQAVWLMGGVLCVILAVEAAERFILERKIRRLEKAGWKGLADELRRRDPVVWMKD